MAYVWHRVPCCRTTWKQKNNKENSNKLVETRLITTVYSRADTETHLAVNLFSSFNNIIEMEIDGIVQPSVVSEYTFSTAGEHTVKYTLADPTSIGDYLFAEVDSLNTVIIPESVTSIGNNTFTAANSITSVTIKSVIPPTLGSNNVFSVYLDYPIYVPLQSVEAYKTASGWSNYADRIQAIS